MVLQDEIEEKEEEKIRVQTCVFECNVSFGVIHLWAPSCFECTVN